MGEKIRDLSNFNIKNNNISIELNNGYSKEHSKYDIHIQSKSMQYSMTDKDFMKLVGCVATAQLRFRELKK